MLKIRATVKGKDIIFLGLDRENIDRMMRNQPIIFGGDQVGLREDVRIVILAGETHADMIEDLRSLGVLR